MVSLVSRVPSSVKSMALVAAVCGAMTTALAGCTAPGVAETDDNTLTLEMIGQRVEAGETSESPLFMTQPERRLVFANTGVFAPVRTLAVGDAPLPLEPAPRNLGDIRYEANGNQYTIADFLTRHPLMGLIVVDDGKVLLEHYAPDHAPDSRWISFSVTKSVTSMLIGAAIQDGYIRSLDDSVVDYLPRLAGSAYEASTIRDILRMASGVDWNEDYEDPESDVSQAGALNGIALTDYLQKLPRVAPSGTTFNYNTGEANLTGEVLRAAIGNGAAPYLSAKIWQPLGMEYSATWLLDAPNGRETGGCCIGATLRDYARLGLFALNDGVLPSGERVLPEGWMSASTAPSPGEPGYGFMWWLNGDGRFGASGIFGQKIFIDPETNVVIAAHSNAKTAVGSDYARELSAALLAITDSLRNEE